MFFENHDQLLQRATEICFAPDGARVRFQSSIEEMGSTINQYLSKMNAPEEEKQLLIGHYGLFGETGNSISQLLLSIHDDLGSGSEQGVERGLKRIFLLTTLENYGSQYSHARIKPYDTENVISACNRIIDHIGKWTDEHVDEIEPLDRVKILNLRHNFATALDEIYTFMRAARPCFEKQDPAPGAPAFTA